MATKATAAASTIFIWDMHTHSLKIYARNKPKRKTITTALTPTVPVPAAAAAGAITATYIVHARTQTVDVDNENESISLMQVNGKEPFIKSASMDCWCWWQVGTSFAFHPQSHPSILIPLLKLACASACACVYISYTRLSRKILWSIKSFSNEFCIGWCLVRVLTRASVQRNTYISYT